MDGFSDLSFFSVLARKPSLAAAAQELGVTPPAVSKRLAALERRLGVRLLHRTTRRISLTAEGETYLQHGARLLEELDALEQAVGGSGVTPMGVLRLSATLGFGRRQLVPALSAFVRVHPRVDVQLHLSDRPVHLAEQGFDLQIRFGEPPDSRQTARRLALNRRVICAAPAYLARAGTPQAPAELAQHPCIFIRESDETYGTWHLAQGTRRETVKVRGPLSTNDGESALAWALDGHGILARSLWDAAPLLRAGQLALVLPQWRLPPADVFAVFQGRSHLPAKTGALLDFLLAWFEPRRAAGDAVYGPW